MALAGFATLTAVTSGLDGGGLGSTDLASRSSSGNAGSTSEPSSRPSSPGNSAQRGVPGARTIDMIKNAKVLDDSLALD
ncbi:hypothetical protein ACIREE_42445 [Streptomyces sp. NPDC102467]|uniref:hypothetical protein n=1 Tax=Streptomyces sp. NPDC102467 TaxID=3366179 RepID=UPI00380253FE